MPPKSFDTVWDDIYESGHEQKAPWDSVISFVYRNRPNNIPPAETHILEVGFGTASNLRFLAREGFQVSGVEGAAKAVSIAQSYFKANNLNGDLRHGDYKELPFEDNQFDLVIDRAALVHSGTSIQQKAIAEILRILKPGGCFHYSPYATTHASAASGNLGADDVTININAGTLQNVGQLRFVSEDDLRMFFPEQYWDFVSIEYQTSENLLAAKKDRMHSNWRVIAKKKSNAS